MELNRYTAAIASEGAHLQNAVSYTDPALENSPDQGRLRLSITL